MEQNYLDQIKSFFKFIWSQPNMSTLSSLTKQQMCI